MTAEDLVKKYEMLPHPEGGWYKETYRSEEQVNGSTLPERFSGNRSLSTAIYFLMEKGNFSGFHRIKSDECWHFYAGQTLLIYVIDNVGKLEIVKLGNNIELGERFQYIVPANYCRLSAGGTTQSLTVGGTQEYSWNVGSDAVNAQSQFIFGENVEVCARRGLLSGLNCTSAPIFVEMNIAAAPTNSHTLYVQAMIDHVVIHDVRSGDIQVRC
jgi:predicted cupin superfamily sugar epimerase